MEVRQWLNDVPTPCYVIDEAAVEGNLRVIDSIRRDSGCGILLALKAFAAPDLFPLMRRYLRGVTASSLNEARLGFEEFGGEIHICCPAYRPDEFGEIIRFADHVVFNSFSQYRRFSPLVESARRKIEQGIRINPEHSEVETRIYDPCRECSRLGVTSAEFDYENAGNIAGLHFHSLCEKNSDALARTLEAVEKRFAPLLEKVKWVNLGGGHHITREDYNRGLLCELINGLAGRYGVKVYLEPGEAVVLNAGVMAASVLDIVHNRMDIAVLDASASAHMPDVIEMPYRPDIVGAAPAGELPHTYRIAGNTCLAGDIIGDYSFGKPLKIGDRLALTDMAHYTIVKNTTFNGINLPSIAVVRQGSGKAEVVRRPGYGDYRARQG